MIALGFAGCIYVQVLDDSSTDSGYPWSDSGGSTSEPDEPRVPAVGDAILYDRQLYGYDAATLSIEWATVQPTPDVNNDWDLLFGNDQDERVDRFTVVTVTDDLSWIVDLGPLGGVDEIPEIVDPDEHPVGLFGAHDELDVVVGHTYWIRTLDTSTAQVGVVVVRDHVVDDHVEVHWCRSVDPDRFVAPPGCGP
ncbi:MAG: hypothetical protein ABMB14_08975 [Myxococcota bacterium]